MTETLSRSQKRLGSSLVLSFDCFDMRLVEGIGLTYCNNDEYMKWRQSFKEPTFSALSFSLSGYFLSVKHDIQKYDNSLGACIFENAPASGAV
jgi:hypothetical protein